MKISTRVYRAYMKYMTREEKIDKITIDEKIDDQVYEIKNPVNRKMLPEWLGNKVDIIV